MTQTLPCESGLDGGTGNGTALAASPSDGPLAMAIFLDVENFRRSMAARGLRPPPWQRLACRISEVVAQQLGLRLIDAPTRADLFEADRGPAVYCREVWAFASKPLNCHPDDQDTAAGVRRSLEELGRLPGFRVQVWPRDLRGQRMRRLCDWEARREKFVDTALAAQLTRRCLSPDAPAIVVVCSGDADMAAPLKAIREDHPEIHVFVAGFRDALASVYQAGAEIGVVWQRPPILLDEWLAALCRESGNKQVLGQGDGAMTGQIDRNGAAGGPGAARVSSPVKDLEIGRVVVTTPMLGRLEVYKKTDGRLGATVICDADGGKYGATEGVRQRFRDPGEYLGWAFVDPRRALAFKFVVGEATSRPEGLLAIEAPEGRVGVPPLVARELRCQHGDYVAFYWRLTRGRVGARPQRDAWRVFPLDEAHVPLILRLVAQNRLSFPEHAEVLQMFFDLLPRLDGKAREHAELLDAALARLATDPSLPADLQMLARVERNKARVARTGRTVTMPQRPDDSAAGRAVTQPGLAEDDAGKPTPAGDVARVKLQLD